MLSEPITYQRHDLDLCMEMLRESNVFYQKYDPNLKVRGFSSKKYLKLIKPYSRLFDNKLRVNANYNASIEYVYWNDINELIERVCKLHSRKQAGHTGLDNEIASIEED